MVRGPDLARLTAATLLFSLVGVVARTLPMASGHIALWRSGIAATAMLVVLLASGRNPLALRARDLPPLLASGVCLAANWYFYFEAIRVSSVSVAVVALFTYPLITVLLEPPLLGTRYRWTDVLAGAAVLAGVVLIVPRFAASDRTLHGVLFGILSAVSLSLFNLLSRRLVRSSPVLTLLFWQFLIAGLLFLPMLPAPRLSAWSAAKLLFLGAVLTTGSQVLFLDALRRFTAAAASILTSLPPFYTVLLAWMLLGETPTRRTVGGGVLITIAVLAVTLTHGRRAPLSPSKAPV